MQIKQATATVIVDSTEVATALKPWLAIWLSQLGKIKDMKLEDVVIEVSFDEAKEKPR